MQYWTLVLSLNLKWTVLFFTKRTECTVFLQYFGDHVVKWSDLKKNSLTNFEVLVTRWAEWAGSVQFEDISGLSSVTNSLKGQCYEIVYPLFFRYQISTHTQVYFFRLNVALKSVSVHRIRKKFTLFVEGPRWWAQIMKKSRGKKSRDTLPLKW